MECGREPPFHTDAFPERKRRSSAARNASTTPKTRKKVERAKGKATQSHTGFYERCNQLLQFKEELDTAMFLEDMQAIDHWEPGAAS